MGRDHERESNLPSFVQKFISQIRQIVNPCDIQAQPIDAKTIFIRNMLTGGVSASVAVTVMAPIERIKLILQIQNSITAKPGTVPYNGLVDALVRIPREQGVMSFWRGNLASVIRGFPYQALNFAFRDKYKDYFVRRFDKKSQYWRRFGGNLLSGGIAGATSMAILYPLDYARTRMAMDFGKSKKTREIRNIRDIIRETYKRDGAIGLYRGFWFSLIGVFVYRSAYFGLFDAAKDAATDEMHSNLIFAFVTAECAATISGFLAYPFDTVRRSMMMQSGKSAPEKRFTGSLDCIQKIYAHKGLRGFYYGGFTNVIRGTGGAIMLVLYDEIQHDIWRRHSSPPASALGRRTSKTDQPCSMDLMEDLKGRDTSATVCTEQLSPCPVRKFAERINLICDH